MTRTLDVGFLEQGAAARRGDQQRRFRIALAVSAAVTIVWLCYVTASGQWGRVGDRWAAALTMVFGSFVAGSTPQGGGAVAFPVFTKVLDVPADVARTFSLSVQTVGMSTASLAIIINRRRVDWQALAIGVPAACVTFLVAAVVLGDESTPFWSSIVPGPYVKVTFTVVLAAMAWVVLLGQRVPVRLVEGELPSLNQRLVVALIIAGALGGLASALVGSGADVFMYLFVVVLIGLDPRVGVPTSVLAMTVVSIVGFVLYGLIDGQLAVQLDSSGETVTSIGDMSVSLEASRFDLFGFWLAAAPVVAWGAPVGSWAASKMSARQLVTFVIALAVAEVVSTAIFLTELRTSPALLTYAVVGLVVALGGLTLLARYRRVIFGLPPIDGSTTLDRGRVDITESYGRSLSADDGHAAERSSDARPGARVKGGGS